MTTGGTPPEYLRRPVQQLYHLLLNIMPVIGTSRYDAVYKPSLVNLKNSPCEGLFVARYNL